MRYHELFESDSPASSLVNSILDLLTPLASNGVEYVTVDQVIDKMKAIPSGLHVDRKMVMDILDPNKFPLIQKIEGDKLYLNAPIAPERSVNDKQKDKEADKIKTNAADQAKKAVTNSAL